MNTIFADECFQYLIEAHQYLKEIVPIDPYYEIFEAETEEMETQLEKNKKASDGVVGSIGKAISALLKFIGDAIKTIIGGFEKIFASKETKDDYARVKEAMEKDPKLANKKFTFYNYKHDYQQLLSLEKRAAAVDKDLENGNDVETESLISELNSFASGVAKGAGTAVVAQFALNSAYGSKAVANEIAKRMSQDASLLKQLEEGMGKHQAKKFQKEINKLSSAGDSKFFKLLGKRVNLKRSLNKARAQQCSSISKAFSYTMQELTGLISNTKSALGHTAQNNELAAQGIKTLPKRLSNNAKMATGMMPVATNGLAQKALGNKDVQGALKTGIDISGNASKKKINYLKRKRAAKKEQILDTADYNRRTRAGDYSAQPLMSFLTNGADEQRINAAKNAQRQSRLIDQINRR